MAITCKGCGTANPDDSHYCARCGKPLLTYRSWLTLCDEDELYVVVKKREYEAMKSDVKRGERASAENRRLRQQLADNPWTKLTTFFKENGGGIAVVVGGVLGLAALICTLIYIGYVIVNAVASSGEGIEVVERDGRFGLHDLATDQDVVPCTYDSIVPERYSDFFRLYADGGRLGIASTVDGSVAYNADLDSVTRFASGLWVAHRGDLVGLFTRDGHRITNVQFSAIENPSRYTSNGYVRGYMGNLIGVKEGDNKNWSIIDRQGKIIVSNRFGSVAQTGVPGLVRVTPEYKRGMSQYGYGLVDSTGRYVLQPEYNDIQRFAEGMSWVRKTYSAPWQLVDTTGRTLVTLPKQYSPEPFSHGMAPVRDSNGKIGYYDTTGRLAIPCKFTPVHLDGNTIRNYDFSDSTATVALDGVPGRVDRLGRFHRE